MNTTINKIAKLVPLRSESVEIQCQVHAPTEKNQFLILEYLKKTGATLSEMRVQSLLAYVYQKYYKGRDGMTFKQVKKHLPEVNTYIQEGSYPNEYMNIFKMFLKEICPSTERLKNVIGLTSTTGILYNLKKMETQGLVVCLGDGLTPRWILKN